jgi:hypothetical protein
MGSEAAEMASRIFQWESVGISGNEWESCHGKREQYILGISIGKEKDKIDMYMYIYIIYIYI